MIIDDNIFSQIDDSIEFTSSAVTGYFSFSDFEAQTEDETADRFFEYFFCYAKDGIHFTDFEILSAENLAKIGSNINYKDSLIFKFRVIRSGTDDSGTITFNDLRLIGNYNDILNGEVFDKSIVSHFNRSIIDFAIEKWALNVLEKVYTKGTVPNFLIRNENSNYEEDRDFIKYWKSVSQYLAIYVVLARDFSRFFEDEKLLLEFLKQRGLFFCEDDTDFLTLKMLAENYYDEIKKRGTIQIIRRGNLNIYQDENSLSNSSSNSISDSSSNSNTNSDNIINSNVNLNGEFLRLICYDICDEFIFNFRKSEKFGWNLRNASPLYRGVSNMIGFNKSYEDTQDFIDLNKYPIINNPVITTDDDKSILRLKAIDGNGKVGIGFDIDQESLFGSELIENNEFLNPATAPIAPRWTIGSLQNPLQFDFSTTDEVKFIYPNTGGTFSKLVFIQSLPTLMLNESEGIFEVKIKIKSNTNLNNKVRLYAGGSYSPYVSSVDEHVFRIITNQSILSIFIFVEFDLLSVNTEELVLSSSSLRRVLSSSNDQYNKQDIQSLGIVIDQNTNYEITFYAKANQQAIDDGGFYFGALIFDCDNNLLELRNISNLKSNNLFLENYQFSIAEKYVFIRGMIFGKKVFSNYDSNATYKKGAIVREANVFYRAKRSIDINTTPSLNINKWQVIPDSDLQRILKTNLAYGNNLSQSIDTHKLVPLIYCKHPSPNPSASIKIYDLKIKPVSTPYSTGFIQADKWLDIFAKNRNINYSNKNIDKILRKYLLPYDVEFKVTYLELDDIIAGRYNPNGFNEDDELLPCENCGNALDFVSNSSIDGWYVDDNSRYLFLKQGGGFGNMLDVLDTQQTQTIPSTSNYFRGKCFAKGLLFVYTRNAKTVEIFQNNTLINTLNLARNINALCYDEHEDLLYFLSNDSGKKLGTINPNDFTVIDSVGITFPGSSILLISINYNPVTFEKYITDTTGMVGVNNLHVVSTFPTPVIKTTILSTSVGVGLWSDFVEFNRRTGEAWNVEQTSIITVSQIKVINPITYSVTLVNTSFANLYPISSSANGALQSIVYYPGNGSFNSERMFIVYKHNSLTEQSIISFQTNGSYNDAILITYPTVNPINVFYSYSFDKTIVSINNIIKVYNYNDFTFEFASIISTLVSGVFLPVEDLVNREIIYHSYDSGIDNILFIGLNSLITKLCTESVVNMYLSNSGPYKWNSITKTWDSVIDFTIISEDVNNITIQANILPLATASLYYSIDNTLTWVQLSIFYDRNTWLSNLSFIKPSLIAVKFKIVVQCDCGCLFDSKIFE